MTDAPSPTPPDPLPTDASGERAARCSQQVSEGVRDALRSGLTPLADELERRRRATYDAAASGTLGELKRELKRHGHGLPGEFMRAFEAMQDNAAHTPGDYPSPPPRPPLRASEPLQVGDTVFSKALAVSEQAALLREACQAELDLLEPAFAGLNAQSGRSLTPETLADALRQACWSLNCSPEAALTLYRLIVGHIALTLPGIYRSTLAIVHDVPPAAVSPALPANLQRLLDEATTRWPQDDGVRRAIEAVRTAAAEASLAPPANLARQLLDAGIGPRGTLDTLILGAIATLFDAVLDDPRLPTEMKALIGQLQIPVLETALRDPAFLSQREHPARRLIGTLARAAITSDEDFSRDTALYRLTAPLVKRIHEMGSSDTAAFASAQDMLQAFLDEQERIQQRKKATLARQASERETRQLARDLASAAVAEHAEDKTLPYGIRDLLQRRWRKVLTVAARNGGEQGTRWIAALAVMNDLVWSVRPKATPLERQRLVDLLPDLLARIKAGLISIDMPEDQRKQFFARLVRLHAQAIKTGMQPTPPIISPPDPASAQLPAAAQPALTAAPVVQRGDSIALTLHSGERCIVRLTWVSPAETMYLFSTRQGARAITLTRSELERRLTHGEALRIEDGSITDRLLPALRDLPPEPEQAS